MSLGTAYWTLEMGKTLKRVGESPWYWRRALLPDAPLIRIPSDEKMLLFMPLFLDILKRLSQYLCFARLILVGGHFLKWRTSNIFVFCPFSPDKIDINWIEYGK